MKNSLFIDIDSDRTEPGPIIIGKPAEFSMPKNAQEHAQMVMDDMISLCEALCTMIHLAEDQGIKPSADSLRDCIKHLTAGFADASYETSEVSRE